MSKKNGEVKDCFERVNRATFAFNQGLDKAIIKPMAQGYRKLPDPIQRGTSNAVKNLSNLVTIPNNVLQGDIKLALINRYVNNCAIYFKNESSNIQTEHLSVVVLIPKFAWVGSLRPPSEALSLRATLGKSNEQVKLPVDISHDIYGSELEYKFEVEHSDSTVDVTLKVFIDGELIEEQSKFAFDSLTSTNRITISGVFIDL